MNIKPALSIIARIEEVMEAARPSAQAQGKGEFLERDKMFLSQVRECLRSNESEAIRWAFDQMRNLSQGFGSYCSNLKKLDNLLDELYSKLEQLISVY